LNIRRFICSAHVGANFNVSFTRNETFMLRKFKNKSARQVLVAFSVLCALEAFGATSYALGQSCAEDADCETNLCQNKVCVVAAACDDGAKNGDETDVDCGGSCGVCSVDQACVENVDCENNSCEGGLCTAVVCDPETGLAFSGGAGCSVSASGGGASTIPALLANLMAALLVRRRRGNGQAA
jgi:MYXO-CTERM domain-containing protein